VDILIIFPPAGFPSGNRGTATQWAGLLEKLGHHVRLAETYSGEDADLLIALHATSGRPALVEFAKAHPDRMTIVALTGTDLYPALSSESLASLELADRLVALHPKAYESIPEELHDKLHVIVQSAAYHPANAPDPDPGFFQVCVVGHLREIKDPMRAAAASRLVPRESRLRVRHAGRILEKEFAEMVEREEAENSRYRYLGELRPDETQAVIASSRLLVLSSRSEGGARVLGEALVAGTPVLATRNQAAEGLLHEDYPGLFEFGETKQLASLMTRAETEPAFFETLMKRTQSLAAQFDPAREREAWHQLLDELKTGAAEREVTPRTGTA